MNYSGKFKLNYNIQVKNGNKITIQFKLWVSIIQFKKIIQSLSLKNSSSETGNSNEIFKKCIEVIKIIYCFKFNPSIPFKKGSLWLKITCISKVVSKLASLNVFQYHLTWFYKTITFSSLLKTIK